MTTNKGVEHGHDAGMHGMGWLLALLSLLAGSVVLALSWYMYQRRIAGIGFDWYDWIPFGLIVLGGVLCLIAAPMLALHMPAGRSIMHTAIGIIPVMLCLRLMIVGAEFIGYVAARLMDGTLFDGLQFRPTNIAINILVVVVILSLIALLRKVDASKGAPQE